LVLATSLLAEMADFSMLLVIAGAKGAIADE